MKIEKKMKGKWKSSPLTGRDLCSQLGRPEWTPSHTASAIHPLRGELTGLDERERLGCSHGEKSN